MSDSDDEVIHIHVKLNHSKGKENVPPTNRLENLENEEKLQNTFKSSNQDIADNFVTPQRTLVQKSFTQEIIETPQFSEFNPNLYSQSQERFKTAQQHRPTNEHMVMHEIGEVDAYKQTYESMKPIIKENQQRKANKLEKLKKLQKIHETKLHDQEIQNNKLVSVLQKERFELEQKIEFSRKELEQKEEMKKSNENYNETLEIRARNKSNKETFNAISASLRDLVQVLSNNIIHEDDFKDIDQSNFQGEIGEKYKELIDTMKDCFISKYKDDARILNDVDSIPINF